MLMSGNQRMLTRLPTTLKASTTTKTTAVTSGATTTTTTTTNDINNSSANSNESMTTKLNQTTTTAITQVNMAASMLAEVALAAVGGAGTSITDVGSLPTKEQLCGDDNGRGGVPTCGEINGNPTTSTPSISTAMATATTTTTTATHFYTNIMGNYNSHKNSNNSGSSSNASNESNICCYNNNNNNNSNINNNNSNSNKVNHHMRQPLFKQQPQQQQQMNVAALSVVGPGRPPPDSSGAACGSASPTNMMSTCGTLYGSGDRATLGDFNLNVSGSCASSIAGMYNTANANNSNNINSSNSSNSNCSLTNCLNGNNDINGNANNSHQNNNQNNVCNNNNNRNNNNNTNDNNMCLAIDAIEHKQQQLRHQLHFGTQFANEACSPCNTPPTAATLRHSVTTASGGSGIKSDSQSHTHSNSNNNNSLSPANAAAAAAAAAASLGLPLGALPLSLSLHLPLSAGNLTCPGSTLASTTPTALDAMHCAYCCQPICDRYIMRVLDTSFHEGCLKCATCALHLVNSCYARDGKLYCRIDYERQFLRNRCLGCGHRIAADELVMRTFDSVFHLKCFACVVCGGVLKRGEQYVIKQGQLFCRLDYEKEVEMLQGYDFYGDELFASKLDGRRGPKRPRTILNTQQRRAFKASFEMSPKPCRKVRENLAKETGLSLRIVQVWFQNQRAKVKKIQKKAKQEHSKGVSDSQDSQESDNSNLAKIKDEAHSDCESLLESPYSVACAGSSVGEGGGGSVSSCADGVVKMRSIKDENENMSFNCMETNKENCNKTNEPFLSTVLGLSYSTFQQLMGPLTQSPMVNPIDRLYSMQNSYFRPEELSYGGCSKDLVQP